MSLRRGLAAAAALALLLAPSLAPAAGTVTITEETFSSVRKIGFTWVATAGGAADAQTTAAFTGKIEALATDPDGSTAPTDNYDLVLLDEDGTDVLAGAGANRDTATNEIVLSALLGIVANDRLTLQVTNAGSGGAGRVWVYIQ